MSPPHLELARHLIENGVTPSSLSIVTIIPLHLLQVYEFILFTIGRYIYYPNNFATSLSVNLCADADEYAHPAGTGLPPVYDAPQKLYGGLIR